MYCFYCSFVLKNILIFRRLSFVHLRAASNWPLRATWAKTAAPLPYGSCSFLNEASFRWLFSLRLCTKYYIQVQTSPSKLHMWYCKKAKIHSPLNIFLWRGYERKRNSNHSHLNSLISWNWIDTFFLFLYTNFASFAKMWLIFDTISFHTFCIQIDRLAKLFYYRTFEYAIFCMICQIFKDWAFLTKNGQSGKGAKKRQFIKKGHICIITIRYYLT